MWTEEISTLYVSKPIKSSIWIMVTSTTEQHQCYMEFTLLLFYFIAVVVIQVKCYAVCSFEAVHMVQSLLYNLTRMQELYDCKLYTPTLNDYKNCSSSTLNCLADEMNVFIEETESKTDLYRMLRKLSKNLKDKKTPCPKCEVYEEQKAEIFLKTLQDILQAMNSMNNCNGQNRPS